MRGCIQFSTPSFLSFSEFLCLRNDSVTVTFRYASTGTLTSNINVQYGKFSTTGKLVIAYLDLIIAFLISNYGHLRHACQLGVMAQSWL